MKVVASTEAYTIFLRGDGRHAVKGADKKAINGDEKIAILLEHGLITAPAVKAPEPESEPESEPAAETEAAAAEGAEEASADDEGDKAE